MNKSKIRIFLDKDNYFVINNKRPSFLKVDRILLYVRQGYNKIITL